jgi:hypothetical protein
MAAPDYAAVKAYDYGYIKGADLLIYCPYQLLAQKAVQDTTILESAVLTAYSEVISNLVSRYDIEAEFLLEDTARYPLIVKLTALIAIRNIVAGTPGLPENMQSNFTWADNCLKSIRQGQISLTGLKQITSTQASTASLIDDNFITLG